MQVINKEKERYLLKFYKKKISNKVSGRSQVEIIPKTGIVKKWNFDIFLFDRKLRWISYQTKNAPQGCDQMHVEYVC